MRSFFAFLTLFIFSAAVFPQYAFADAAAKPVIKVAPPAPKFTDAERQAELARRRAAVAAKMADKSVLVLFSTEPRIYAYDVDYVYRQENNLYYLTGLKQDNATLVLYKDGSSVSEYLFLPKRSYFAEAWNGKMYPVDEAARISGIKTIIAASEQPAFLAAVTGKTTFAAKEGTLSIPSASKIYLLLPNNADDDLGIREYTREIKFNEALKNVQGVAITNARPIFEDLRHIKSPYELKLLQHAIDITTEAQMRSMAMVGRAAWEYQVQAEVEYTFRRRNADFWGYPSIVGCGPNATTLHYVEAQGKIDKSDVLLMDVGAEYDHYTADVTRTYPVSGKFSAAQADLYRIVYDAQEAAAKATKPGATMQQISAAADNVIKEGLFKLGLITDKNSMQFKIWYLHGLGHWLGMNVHDVGRYGRAFEPGMVFTNEPGIYIREEALDNLPKTPEMQAFIEKVRPAFEKYKNIGIRIEDDMLVTQNGVEWMTKALPRRLEDVEAFMAQAAKELPYNAVNLGTADYPSVAAIGFADHSAVEALFGARNYPAGTTARRGFVWAGKNAAVSGLSHADHLHAE